MIKAILEKIFGTKHQRSMKKLRPLVESVEQWEKKFEPLSDEELAAKTVEFRARIKNGETTDQLLPEAFAVVRLAAIRTLGMRHYNVQIIGGITLHRGIVAEMKTGEGKTLTSTLALYLNALEGKGAHLVTVNDYLASRDAAWMGKIYTFLGMTVGTIVPNMSNAERKEAYLCDVTYGTNNEFGFDYLRDNMKYSIEERVQRDLFYSIVDEVDSVLIDEARTPLIISGRADKATNVYTEINDIVSRMKRDEDYIVDEEHRSVTLTDEGIEKAERELKIDNLFDPVNVDHLHHINKALDAHTLYVRGEKYLVEEGKVIIVDDFTGRKMAGRRWSDGLHQAVEAKEHVPIQNESITMATITYQNFFRMYERLSGMTGTADTEAEELNEIYKLSVVVIPTNRPIIRIDNSDVVYRTEREKFTAIVEEIIERHEKGQPCLIGTVSVDKSEVISKVLRKKKIPHNVLNAKNHENEAVFVAQAGRTGAITIATNMAGRGTDIVLGGNPAELALSVDSDKNSEIYKRALEKFTEKCAVEREEVLKAGGLFILGTERHDSRRIDNQLRGRSGRQGDPGASRFFLSLEDDLMRRFGADKIQGLMERLGIDDGVPMETGMVTRAIENAQSRVEGRNYDIRKSLLEYDDVMDQQRSAVYTLRLKILKGDDIEELILDLFDETLLFLLDAYCNEAVRVDDWDMEVFATEIKKLFNIEIDIEALPRVRVKLEKVMWKDAKISHDKSREDFNQIADYKNTVTGANLDQIAVYKNTTAGAKEGGPKHTTGEKEFIDFMQKIYLAELDRRYREHLNAMKNLRDAVRLHSYAQKDPKYIYKEEGYQLYQRMRREISSNVVRTISHYDVEKVVKNSQRRDANAAARRTGSTRSARSTSLSLDKMSLSHQPQSQPQPPKPKIHRELPNIGRNEKCWCDSGKKYKHCHMQADKKNQTKTT